MEYSRDDRNRAREELGLPADAKVIAVIPGAWATEERTPLWELLLAAFDALDVPGKHLVWNAGEDAGGLARRSSERSDISVIQSCDPIERLMAACDLGITKGNRGTTLDFSYVGIPSISISFRANPVDDHMVPQIRTNTVLYADELDAASLAGHLSRALRAEKPAPVPMPPSDAARQAALRIAHHLELADAAKRGSV